MKEYFASGVINNKEEILKSNNIKSSNINNTVANVVIEKTDYVGLIFKLEDLFGRDKVASIMADLHVAHCIQINSRTVVVYDTKENEYAIIRLTSMDEIAPINDADVCRGIAAMISAKNNSKDI